MNLHREKNEQKKKLAPNVHKKGWKTNQERAFMQLANKNQLKNSHKDPA